MPPLSSNVSAKPLAGPARPQSLATRGLALAALGVVYGDIGTSPLYALQSCFVGDHAVRATPLNILGVLSLIFWALTLVVSVKYLVFILRADNHGEGGILALTALLGAVLDETLEVGTKARVDDVDDHPDIGVQVLRCQGGVHVGDVVGLHEGDALGVLQALFL